MPRTHAALPRLFVESDLSAGAQLTLGKEQSLYLAAVLRKTVGDEVVLFNGRDGAWLARLSSDAKKSVVLKLVERFPIIIQAGAAVLAFTAAKMITAEPLFDSVFDPNAAARWSTYAVCIAGVLGAGWLASRAARRTTSGAG